MGDTAQRIEVPTARNRSVGRVRFVVALEDSEDGFIVSSCPALPGCYSQGRSREEALANIKEAIEGFVEVMLEDGETLPPRLEFHEIEVEI